ncbi:MAG: PASTA domain-containing protein [Actinobacteria bacterium]|nr:PASTA domain-containing protein [Actinomycetota bacterium]
MRGVAGVITFSLVAMASLSMILVLSGCGGSTPKTPLTTVIPALGGMSVEEAEALLSGEELGLGTLMEEYSDTVPAGLIIRTMPPEGEEVDRGTAVDLVVSRGPEPVTLPDLRGKSEGEAVSILQGLGLQANLQRSYNESVSAGLVCSSEPAPGTPLARGSAVTLTVSLGSAYVTCPTCRGKGTVTVAETCPECGGSGVCYG